MDLLEALPVAVPLQVVTGIPVRVLVGPVVEAIDSKE